MTDTNITASMLYDHTQCPYRVYADLYEDPSKRDPISPFVKLLWERGNLYEEEVIEALKVPFTDLGGLPGDERERRTQQAMDRGDPLIYQGRIRAGNLLGDPDLLRKQGDGYVPGDIKSGAGLEGGNDLTDGKPKVHYAVQLALYQDILQQMGRSSGRTPFVIDIHGNEVPYPLDEQMGPKSPTPWKVYQNHLFIVSRLINEAQNPLPALSGGCKLCHWRTSCKTFLTYENDISLIPELGRSKRDVMAPTITTVAQLAQTDISQYVLGSKKTIFPRISPETLTKFQLRAQLLSDPDAKPRVTSPYSIPRADKELYFDVETDPMRDICYLHGFWEVSKAGERYVYFLAEHPDPADEAAAFRAAWQYIKASMPCHIYYYSPYERTTWRKLVENHPDVMTVDEVEELFSSDQATDLYGIVRSSVEFPTHDKSVKTLAKYFGFEWRDTDPSGAGSIEWYHRYTESVDESILKRILEYNEDDCIAMKVLVEGLEQLL